MTEEMKRMPEDAPDWTIPDDTAPEGKDGLKRRTILLGAAWSVPVIAAAVGAPLAAASTTNLELAFVDGPYQAIACGPLDDITVRATRGGTAAPGEPITVILPSGLTWSDGTTAPRTMVSDANGDIVLSGVLAGNANGNYALGATSGTATAASNAEVAGADRGVISQFGGIFLQQLPAGVLVEDVQTGSNPDGSLYAMVLGSDGHVYRAAQPVGSTTWGPWVRSTSTLAGSLTGLAVSTNGGGNVIASDTRVSPYGGTASAPLPGGASIVEVKSYLGSDGRLNAIVVGSDGRAYYNHYDGNSQTWSGWTAHAAATGVTQIAVGETGGGSVVASENRVAALGGNSSPLLPNGANITDMSMYVNASGVWIVSVTGSDGRAYNITRSATTSEWGAWNTSTSPLNGSVQQIDITGNGSFTVVGTGNQVSLFGGSPASPPLPNGATIIDMQGANDRGNQPNVSVIGSDGRAYVTAYINGAWTPWRASRVGQGRLEQLAVGNGAPWTLVAGNPTC